MQACSTFHCRSHKILSSCNHCHLMRITGTKMTPFNLHFQSTNQELLTLAAGDWLWRIHLGKSCLSEFRNCCFSPVNLLDLFRVRTSPVHQNPGIFKNFSFNSPGPNITNQWQTFRNETVHIQ